MLLPCLHPSSLISHSSALYGSVNIQQIRSKVTAGDYDLRPHAMQHSLKEGFTEADMAHVVVHGEVIEEYPERSLWILSLPTSPTKRSGKRHASERRWRD
jgi:hypothetical protein